MASLNKKLALSLAAATAIDECNRKTKKSKKTKNKKKGKK